jgi:hypothetical protein
MSVSQTAGSRPQVVPHRSSGTPAIASRSKLRIQGSIQNIKKQQ